MHPSPSADTCGPFFPNFRYSIFPPRCGLLLRCSQFEERYGPGQKNECLTLILGGGRVPHPCAFVSRRSGDFSSLFSNFDFLISILLAGGRPSIRSDALGWTGSC